jgi:hypothetical protein
MISALIWVVIAYFSVITLCIIGKLIIVAVSILWLFIVMAGWLVFYLATFVFEFIGSLYDRR